MITKRLICASVAAVAIALSLPSSMLAAGTLSAGPAVVMLKGTAGQTTTQTLLLENATDQALSFEMKAKDVLVRDGLRIMSDAGAVAGSIAATAVFSQQTITLQAGENARVDVTLTIPENPAGRAVVALFQGTDKLKNGSTSMIASLGTLLTFALSDNVAAEASALAVQAPTATSNLVVGHKLLSSGSEPFVAKGMLAIVNETGALVGKEAISARRMLPGEEVEIRAEYGGELLPGRYRALITYDLAITTLTATAEFDVR